MNGIVQFAASLVVCACLAASLAGCRRGQGVGPPDIHFGQDTCHACGMILQDERYASAVITLAGGTPAETFLFDDPGEMLRFVPPADSEQTLWFVRDADTRHWLDATKATFIKAKGLETPMGSGVAAYCTREAAQAAALAHAGDIASFDELRQTSKK